MNSNIIQQMDFAKVFEHVEEYADNSGIELDNKNKNLLLKVYIADLYEEVVTLRGYIDPIEDHTIMFKFQDLARETHETALKHCCKTTVNIYRLAASSKARGYCKSRECPIPPELPPFETVWESIPDESVIQ